MKIDLKKIEMLRSMSDERMWNTVRLFAAANGIDMSRRRITPRETENIKAALGTLTEDDVKRINEFLGIAKYGRRR